MPRLTEVSRQRRRDTIAAAAMRCFARDGFSNTSMADIITEAGTSSGSVYSNFSNKTELVRYAASSALHALLAPAIAELPLERSPAIVLLQLLRASADRTHAQTLLQIWAAAPRDPELVAVTQRTTLELRAQIKTLLMPWFLQHVSTDASPTESVDGVADAILTALQGFLVRVSIDHDVDPTVLADRVATGFQAQ